MIRPTFLRQDLSSAEIQAWFRHRLAGKKDHIYADHKIALKAVAGFSLLALFYALALQGGGGLYFTLTALAGLFLVFNLAHDASHGAIFRRLSANSWLCRLVFLPLGIDGHLWGLRHIKSHHPYTNIPEADPDVAVGRILRITPRQEKLRFHRLQALYAPFLYCLAIPAGTWLKDFRYFFEPGLAEKSMRRGMNRREKALFLAGKILHFAMWFLIPRACGFGWGSTFLNYFVAMGICSLTFVFLAALNHFSEFSQFPEPCAQGTLDSTWFEHQLRTNADWRATSWWTCFLLGGANAHVAHHLFPKVSHRHLYSLTEKIREKCLETGTPYYNQSFTSGLRSHFRFLDKMGR